jgi:hypothetical protein
MSRAKRSGRASARRSPPAQPAIGKRGKVVPTVSTSAPSAPPLGGQLLPGSPTAPTLSGPVKDWKADPDLRAFACLLSYDAGWLQEPDAIVWTFDDKTKLVTVKRPEGSADTKEFSAATFVQDSVTSLIHIERRWTKVWADKVRAFSAPGIAGPANGSPLGDRAVYLKQLAGRARDTITATAYLSSESVQHVIECALVDVARYCASLAENANLGDQTISAKTTRAVARGAIVEMISPPPRFGR